MHSWVWILCIFICIYAWRVVCPIVQPNRIRGEKHNVRSFCTTIIVAVLKIHPPQNFYAFWLQTIQCNTKQYLHFKNYKKSTNTVTFIPQANLYISLSLRQWKPTSTVINKCFAYFWLSKIRITKLIGHNIILRIEKCIISLHLLI